MKAEFEKPGKYQFEILVNNKSAKKNEITVTDVKKESVLEHKF
ncbi:FimD/PapC N-terminal domain-containing protein [Sphingobacterium endophyticum]|nr:FimD/PapC N-terminal domain-containing protein [Sphingobacterium endophyticum]